MDNDSVFTLETPRVETCKPLLLAGLRERHAFASVGPMTFAGQWQRFMPRLSSLPRQLNRVGYALCYDMFGDADHFEYFIGVEVDDASRLPPGLSSVTLPAQRYAMFPHRGDVSTLHQTCGAIWRDWLPRSGETPAGHPDFIEHYGERFDPKSHSGDLEIWVPLRA